MKAIYAGSFDPLTNGHLDIIRRASLLFSDLTVGIAQNPEKNPCFTLAERKKLILESVKDIKNVKVVIFKGLLADYVKENNINVIVRGLRAVMDYEPEFRMAIMNKKLYPMVETVFLITDLRYSFITSSAVKEIAALHGNIDGLVPEHIKLALYKKFRK